MSFHKIIKCSITSKKSISSKLTFISSTRERSRENLLMNDFPHTRTTKFMWNYFKPHFFIKCFFSFYCNQLYTGTSADWCSIFNILNSFTIKRLTRYDKIYIIYNNTKEFNIKYRDIKLIYCN